MNEVLPENPAVVAHREYTIAVAALNRLPDRCAADINDLATRLGTEKTTLLGWLRADLTLARLVASKVLK